MPELMNYLENGFADLGIIVALIAVVAFTISYGAFFNWRKTPAGRAVMWVFISLVAVAAIAFLGRWIGDDYWFRWLLRPIVWWGVAAATIRLNVTLWASYRAGESPLGLDPKQRTKKGKSS